MTETVTERTIFAWDFQKNKKLALLANGFGIFLMAVMFVFMYLTTPIQMMRWGMEQIGVAFWLLGLLAAAALCEVIKALIHRVCRKPGEEVRVMKKGGYILRALLPVLVMSLVLAVVQAMVPMQWRWFVFLVQMVNVAGAARELLTALRLLFTPKGAAVTVLDMGIRVCAPERGKKTYEEA